MISQKRPPLFRVYHNMKTRCYNPNTHNYARYGGRGIAICDRWLGVDGYSNFIKDMGERPSSLHQLDRINNDKGYSPENCRWATPTENGMNKSNNKRVTCQGATKTLSEWSRLAKCKRSTFSMRYYKYGWDIGRCLQPVRKI